MLCAARNLRRNGFRKIAVLLTSDEEGEAINGTRHVVQWRKQNNAPPVPFVIVGEPTCEKEFGDAIKIGRRGSLTARIVIRGMQTHAAYPERGDNPIPRLLSALSDILQRAEKMRAQSAKQSAKTAGDSDDAENSFPPLGAQIVKTESGIAENVIPPAAAATINFRYSPRDNADNLRAMTESALQHSAPDKWTCEWRHSAIPFFSPPGKLANALRERIFAECGRRAKLSVGGGTSDGRFLREIAGEIAEFGVIGETMHEPNERVARNSPEMLTRIYENVARILLK